MADILKKLLLCLLLLHIYNNNAGSLKELKDFAKKIHSDAILIVENNKVILEDYFDTKPHLIPVRSINKSIVGLCIGILYTQKKIDLDCPIYTFYPEWNQGRKKKITVRQILNHTSGLYSQQSSREIEASPNFVQFALCSEMTDDPGTKFYYNNNAVNLLAGIIEKITGMSLDKFCMKELFAPLGIATMTWWKDSVGNPAVMAGVSLYPHDLAKIGQLVLDNGFFKGNMLISADYMKQMLQPQPLDEYSGLLWWLIYDSQVTPFKKSTSKKKKSTIVGYGANGYLGQQLIIYPDKKLVTVGMVDDWNESPNSEEAQHNFYIPEFQQMVYNLELK